jgi:hypothetical protein
MQTFTQANNTRIAVQHPESLARRCTDQHPAIVRAKVERGKGRSRAPLIAEPDLTKVVW